MSDVIAFLNRQNGKSNRKTYDTALTRLCVHKNDCWRGIVPSVDVADYNPEPPIFAAKFANMPSNKHILALANEDGKIALQNSNTTNDDTMEKALDGKQCHNNAVFDLEWMPGDMKFVSASGDHTARLWSVQESCFKLLQVFHGHTRSVKTAAWRTRDPAIFATGGRDGAIMIWDTRVALHINTVIKADNCIFSGHLGCSATPPSVRRRGRTLEKSNFYTVSNSITGLVFNDDFTLISCGAGDGIIKVWDLRRNYTTYKKEPTPKHCFNYPGTTTFKGYTNLIIDNLSHRLYVNCMDNNIYCYNISKYTAHPIMKYSGFRNGTFYIKSCLSPDGRYIVSGSSDEKAYIWNVNSTEPLVTLGGQSYEVTCVAWSDTNDLNIVTCSDDARHKIWRTTRHFDNDDEENLKLNYRCMAERCSEYKTEPVTQIKDTPKSVKRTISCITYNTGDVNNSIKRMYLGNTNEKLNCNIDASSKSKGRRLFSPSPSTSNLKQTSTNMIDDNNDHEDQLANLAAILEETDTVIDDKNNLNNRINNHIIINSNNSNNSSSISIDNINKNNINKLMSPTKTKLLSPLAERHNCNLMSSPIPTTLVSIAESTDGNCDTTIPNTPTILSLTSNLPNFVIDGEAPHIIPNQISPKRKLKENVDWLTKIRKQKLKSISNQLNDKLSNPPITNNNSNNNNSNNNNSNNNNSNNDNNVTNSDNFNDNECNSKFKESDNLIISHTQPNKKNRHQINTTLLRFFNVIHRKPVISNDIK